MLCEVTKSKCEEILNLLDTDDIFSLKDTVTKNTISAQNRQEAIAVILEYSVSPKELFQRRKLKKEALFQFLRNQGIDATSTDDKCKLIKYATNFIEELSIFYYTQNESSVSSQESPEIVSHIDLTINPSMTSDIDSWNTTREKAESDASETNRKLSEEFVNWFYPMLNAQSRPAEKDKCDWGSHHFWQDCTIQCTYNKLGSNCSETEKYEGSSLVSEWLTSLVTERNLVFNVNNSPSGHIGHITACGLAKVGVCGTLQQLGNSDAHFALFKQEFSLLRDPNSSNNWKIKRIILHVQSTAGEISNINC